MPVRIQWHDDIQALASAAGGALDRVAQPRLFDRIDWLRMTAEHGLAARPLILSAQYEGGAAYLVLARDGWRRAKPFASWYTLAFRPILVGAGSDLLVPLFREAARGIDHLTLAPVLYEDLGAIRSSLEAAGWALFIQRSSTSRVGETSRSFADWWSVRPARLRNTVERRRRSHPLDVTVHDRFSADAWGAYEEVYRASWKPAEGSTAFLRALARSEGAAGTLRLGIARGTGARAIAAQLWLVEGGRATIHKLAHREDARAGSPGSILSAAMFAHVIDRDRVSLLDFGLGDEPYKADWIEEATPVWRIDAYRPLTPLGAVGILRERAARLVHRRRDR